MKNESHADTIVFNTCYLKWLQGIMITWKEWKHYLSIFILFFFVYIVVSTFMAQTCYECQGNRYWDTQISNLNYWRKNILKSKFQNVTIYMTRIRRVYYRSICEQPWIQKCWSNGSGHSVTASVLSLQRWLDIS